MAIYELAGMTANGADLGCSNYGVRQPEFALGNGLSHLEYLLDCLLPARGVLSMVAGWVVMVAMARCAYRATLVTTFQSFPSMAEAEIGFLFLK